jgi:hypothetical protein
MHRFVKLLAVIGFLIIAAHRLPAPIEEEASPSPTATRQATAPPAPTATGPLLKRQAARFAGTWTGKIKFGNTSDVEFTFIINPEATSMIQKSKRFGEHAHPTTVNANTISWTAGAKNAITWTLTPNSDGQTAVVKVKPISGEESTATFQRTESPSKHPRAGARAKSRQ